MYVYSGIELSNKWNPDDVSRILFVEWEITDKQGEKVRMFHVAMFTTGDNSVN